MSLDHKKFIHDLRQNPRVNILHTVKGTKALKIMKYALFRDDNDAAEQWADPFSPADKKSATLLVYSLLKRIHADIIFQLLIDDAVVGHKFNEVNGLRLVREVFRG